MEGINELKTAVEALGPIEKDLNSPLMANHESTVENIETPKEKANEVALSQEDLNRPIEEPATEKELGLSDDYKQELKEQTGWSDNVVESIRTEEEAQVYLDANLKEVNGNLERTNIDWNAEIPQDRIDRMRSLYGDEVADKWANKTNADLIKEGKAPYGPDGQQVNLHHIGQKTDSPLAELTYTEHKQNDGILHDKLKPSEIERSVFRAERQRYWQERYESLQH